MRRVYVIALVFIALLIFVSASLDWARSFAARTVQPAEPVARGVQRAAGFFESLRTIGGLRAQVAELQDANTKLQAEATALHEIINRTDKFTAEIAQTAGFDPSHLLAARVIARSPFRALDEFVVNRGEREGVVTGQAVLHDGMLVGTVRSVSTSTSTITLLTSAQALVPVILQVSRAQGLLHGGLEGMVVNDLPIDVQVKEGEAVLTSALGGVLPADIPVGRVGAVISGRSEVLRRVTLLSPVKFTTLEDVLIVTGVKSEG